MKFVIEHLSKSFEKKKFLKISISHLKKERSTGCSAGTALAKQHFSIV